MSRESGWLPFGIRERGDPKEIEAYERLAAGVPSHIRGSLLRWLEDYVRRLGPDVFAELDLILERGLHRTLGGEKLTPGGQAVWSRMYAAGMRPREIESFLEQLRRDPELLLDAVDLTASAMANNKQHAINEQALHSLAVILSEAGLDLMLLQTHRFCGLVRRVDTTSSARISAAVARHDRPSAHLVAAWAAAFGRRPDPSEAYREAVRAVESAGKPIVSPANTRTSVGTMKRDLRAKPEKWRHELSPSPASLRVDDAARVARFVAGDTTALQQHAVSTVGLVRQRVLGSAIVEHECFWVLSTAATAGFACHGMLGTDERHSLDSASDSATASSSRRCLSTAASTRGMSRP